MALRPKILYPGQTSSVDAGYPHGKARNRATPGDGTGTPWEEQLVNEIFGFQQALLENAKITPNNLPETAQSSQYLQGIGHFTKDLNAVYALQFPEIRRNYSSSMDFPLKFTSCLDADFQPWLVMVNSSGRVERNNGIDPDDAAAGAQPSGGFVPITGLSGGQDGVLIAVEGSTGITYASEDAGQSWPSNTALPSTGNWGALGYSYDLGLWIATGTNKVAYSPAYGSMAWTAGTGSATSWGAPRRVVVPRVGETGHGVMVIGPAGAGPSFYSLDGHDFISTPWGLPVADGCWSEYHQQWFMLTTTGQLFRATTLNGAWSAEATLWQAGFSVYKRIFAMGRHLVILGEIVSGPSNRTVGSVCVTDRSTVGAFTVDGGGHDDFVEFDGRMILARVISGPQLDIAAGVRSPLLL